MRLNLALNLSCRLILFTSLHTLSVAPAPCPLPRYIVPSSVSKSDGREFTHTRKCDSNWSSRLHWWPLIINSAMLKRCRKIGIAVRICERHQSQTNHYTTIFGVMWALETPLVDWYNHPRWVFRVSDTKWLWIPQINPTPRGVGLGWCWRPGLKPVIRLFEPRKSFTSAMWWDWIVDR